MELEQYWQFGAALIFVLALIGVLFWVIQKVGFGGGKGRRGSRLGIVEATVVDKRRRLVLIRRDAVEHLVMIGGPQDVVVENNITRTGPSLTTAATDRRHENGPDLGVRPGDSIPLTAATVPGEPKLADRPADPLVAETTIISEDAGPEAASVMPEPATEDFPPRPQEPIQPPQEPVHAPPPPPAPPMAEPPAKPDAAHVRPDEPPRPEEPRRPEEPPRPTAPARPWPPSEGRFREAQRRFAERSDYNPPSRGVRDQSAAELSAHYPPERQVANRALPDGMPPPERPRDVSQEGSTRSPANLNVRPGED